MKAINSIQRYILRRSLAIKAETAVYDTLEGLGPTVEDILNEYRGYRLIGGVVIDTFEHQLAEQQEEAATID